MNLLFKLEKRNVIQPYEYETNAYIYKSGISKYL